MFFEAQRKPDAVTSPLTSDNGSPEDASLTESEHPIGPTRIVEEDVGRKAEYKTITVKAVRTCY